MASIHDLTLSMAKAQLRQEREARRLQGLIDSQASQILHLSEQHTADQALLKEFSDELQEIGSHHTTNYELQELKLKDLLNENSLLASENANLQQHAMRKASSRSPRRTPSNSPQSRSFLTVQGTPSMQSTAAGGGGSHNTSATKDEDGGGSSHKSSPSLAPSADAEPVKTVDQHPADGECRELAHLEAVESEGELSETATPASTAVSELEFALVQQQLRDAELEIESLQSKLLSSERLQLKEHNSEQEILSEDEQAQKLASLIVVCSEQEVELNEVVHKYNALQDNTSREIIVEKAKANDDLHKAKQELRDAESKSGQLEFELDRLRFEYTSWRQSVGPESAAYQRQNAMCGSNEQLFALPGREEEFGEVSARQSSATSGLKNGGEGTMPESEQLAAVQEARRQERESADARVAQIEERFVTRVATLEAAVKASDTTVESNTKTIRELNVKKSRQEALTRALELRVQEEHDKTLIDGSRLREQLQEQRLIAAKAEAKQKAIQSELDAAEQATADKITELLNSHNLEVSTMKLKLSSATLPVKQLEARLKTATQGLEKAKTAAKDEQKKSQTLAVALEDLERDLGKSKRRVAEVNEELHSTSRRLESTDDLLKTSEDSRRKQVVDLSTQLRATHDRQAANSYQQDRHVVPISAYRDQQLELKRIRQSINDAATIAEMIVGEVSPSTCCDGDDLGQRTPLASTQQYLHNYVEGSSGATPTTPIAQQLSSSSLFGTPLSARHVQDEKSTPVAAGQRLVQLNKDVLNSVRASRGRAAIVFPSPAPGVDQTVRRNATRLSPAPGDTPAAAAKPAAEEDEGRKEPQNAPAAAPEETENAKDDIVVAADESSTKKDDTNVAADVEDDNDDLAETNGSEERKLHFDDAASPQHDGLEEQATTTASAAATADDEVKTAAGDEKSTAAAHDGNVVT